MDFVLQIGLCELGNEFNPFLENRTCRHSAGSQPCIGFPVTREKRTEECIVDLLGSNSTLKYFNLFGPTTSKKIEKHIFYDEILDLQDFQGGQEGKNYVFLSFFAQVSDSHFEIKSDY